MDIPQLKLLAGTVRTLLQQAGHLIGHNQSLDLIAALPGLRNWPEVLAFPERVGAAALDLNAASRLAFRLKKRFATDMTPPDLLAALAPAVNDKPEALPKIWPSGPVPGVYIATSQEAVEALVDRYEEATDGTLFFAEKAASHRENSIDLGENGLWSTGLQHVASGTLIVVGPMRLDQQSWHGNASRLAMMCMNVLTAGSRVAVLVDTPARHTVCEDILQLVRAADPDYADNEKALAGIVTQDGELLRRVPFARPRASVAVSKSVATVDAIPHAVRAHLRKAIAQRKSGLLIFGAGAIGELSAFDLVASGLALTEHAGPAARIKPRQLATPDHDAQSPTAIKQLPLAPSIESAYAQGYRRMVVDPHFTDVKTLIEFGREVLFIAGVCAHDSVDAFLATLRLPSHEEQYQLLEMVIAVLSVSPIPTPDGEAVASDLVVPDMSDAPPRAATCADLLRFVNENRILRLDEPLSRQVVAGDDRPGSHNKSLRRGRAISKCLSRTRA